MTGETRNLDQELDRLLAAYREACEAPEPSAEFMPRLWARIEASEQGWTERLWKWANGLAAAAAVASVLLVALQMTSAAGAGLQCGHVCGDAAGSDRRRTGGDGACRRASRAGTLAG